MKRPYLLLALLLLTIPALGADWPQWRGPYRDGTVSDSLMPEKWPEKLPAPKWRIPIGIGYSSPVIARGQVFIQARDNDGNELCLSFDAQTGKQIWKRSYPSAYAPPDPTAGQGPNSTPTVDRDRVYMLGLGGMFHCLDVKTGKILWKHDMQKEYWGVEKSKLGEDAWFPACGATASALVDGEHVIMPVGGKKAGAFVGFHRKTGKILWKALDDRSSYASPLFADLAGTRQIVGFTGTRLVGLDASDHKLLWEYPFTALYEQTIVTPVIWKNHVIVCGEAKPTHALEITRKGGKVMQKVAWQNADLSAYLVTPIVVSDHLIGYDQRGKRLVSIDLATGKTIWTSPRFGRIFASLVVVGKQILALSDSGELFVLAADPKKYTPLSSFKVAGPGTIWSQLAIVGNRLYIKEKEHLACYEFAG